MTSSQSLVFLHTRTSALKRLQFTDASSNYFINLTNTLSLIGVVYSISPLLVMFSNLEHLSYSTRLTAVRLRYVVFQFSSRAILLLHSHCPDDRHGRHDRKVAVGRGSWAGQSKRRASQNRKRTAGNRVSERLYSLEWLGLSTCTGPSSYESRSLRNCM